MADAYPKGFRAKKWRSWCISGWILPELGEKTLHSSPTSGFSFPLANELARAGASSKVNPVCVLECRNCGKAVGSLVDLEHRTPDRKAWVRCSMSPNTLRVHTDSLAEIVEVEIEVVSPSVVPSGSFTELKSHCHLYGAQGQRQAYLLPMPR
ncbi:hypothetical protein TNCV_896191 [Trichonephila clavipes]|nr:hypothetical protein TNCV_896191 [Trichonephila clavipes]